MQLNTDKGHIAKLNNFKEEYLDKLITIEGIGAEDFWGILVELSVPDPEHSLELDCIATVLVLDPELKQSEEEQELWNIPCDLEEIQLLEVH